MPGVSLPYGGGSPDPPRMRWRVLLMVLLGLPLLLRIVEC